MARKIEKVDGGLKIDGQSFPTQAVEDIIPSSEYVIHIYRFTDSTKGTESDG